MLISAPTVGLWLWTAHAARMLLGAPALQQSLSAETVVEMEEAIQVEKNT